MRNVIVGYLYTSCLLLLAICFVIHILISRMIVIKNCLVLKPSLWAEGAAFHCAVKNPFKIAYSYKLLPGVMGNMIIPFRNSANYRLGFF